MIEVADIWNAVLSVLLGGTVGGLLILVARFLPRSLKKSTIKLARSNTLDPIKTMSFVSSHALQNLLCVKCKKYLSHFPINDSLQPLGSVCGRCPIKDSDQRNTIYEDLAKSQRFACCYDSNGCTENLLPVDVPEHERFCYFRNYGCPSASSTNCKWIGLADELLDHFEKHHRIFFLISGEFEVDFVSNYNENCLLNFENNLFIVNRTNNFKAETMSYNVSYIGTNKHTKDYSYKITLHCGENKSNFHVINNKLTVGADIKRDFILNALNNPNTVIVQVNIIKPKENEADLETYPPVNTELLRELECSYCFEYMLPPIQQCITGHSICSKCKTEVTECPTCKSAFNNTINITLGYLIEHIVFPCKNKGCKFTCKAIDIKKHETNCIFGPIICPLKEYENCECELHYLQVYDHIVNNHSENLLEMDAIHAPFEFVEEVLEDCYIIRYSFQLFKLHCLFNQGKFYWAMQLIGAQGKEVKFKFEIDVVDNFNNNSRVCFRARCGPLTDKTTAFDDSDFVIFIDYRQMKTMITDQFSYRVRIISE